MELNYNDVKSKIRLSMVYNDDEGKQRIIRKNYNFIRASDDIELQPVFIKNGLQRYGDADVIEQSITEFCNLMNMQKIDHPGINPDYFGWVFKSNDVFVGCITIGKGNYHHGDILNKIEQDYIEDELKWMKMDEEKLKNEKPELFQQDDKAIDFAMKNPTDFEGSRRLKCGAGYYYEYPKSKQEQKDWHRLIRSGFKMNIHTFDRFLRLRFMGVFRMEKVPNMMQTIYYKKRFGIGHHADELAWFPYPVYSLRLFGRAYLHFGQKTAAFSDYILQRLSLEIERGVGTMMGGIFQVIFKHNIRNWGVDSDAEYGTIVLRFARNKAVNLWTRLL